MKKRIDSHKCFLEGHGKIMAIGGGDNRRFCTRCGQVFQTQDEYDAVFIQRRKLWASTMRDQGMTEDEIKTKLKEAEEESERVKQSNLAKQRAENPHAEYYIG